jgi:hypothetical protein
MACANPSPDEVPFFVQSWIRSLLDPELLDMLRSAGDRQVEVRLLASKGRVRRRPAVLIDTGGHQEMVDPDEVA